MDTNIKKIEEICPEMREISVRSSIDGSLESSLFYKNGNGSKNPLLVGLHTWSFDRFNQIKKLLPIAKRLGFDLLLPEFRGPNLPSNPRCVEACGSALAMQDIVDAVDFVIENEDCDPENVFLLGQSGGGHMALMMAGKCPERFKAIGAFVPITDLEKWAEQNSNYRNKVLACCESDTDEMKKRSPMSYVDNIARANLKIFHGKYDPVVPVSHSIEIFGAIMEKYPRSRVFLDIFDGGHQIDLNAAEYWIKTQYISTNNTEVTG